MTHAFLPQIKYPLYKISIINNKIKSVKIKDMIIKLTHKKI
jgi:hypothetical protein